MATSCYSADYYHAHDNQIYRMRRIPPPPFGRLPVDFLLSARQHRLLRGQYCIVCRYIYSRNGLKSVSRRPSLHRTRKSTTEKSSRNRPRGKQTSTTIDIPKPTTATSYCIVPVYMYDTSLHVPLESRRSQPVSGRFHHRPQPGYPREGLVRVDKATPARVVRVLYGLSKRAHAQRISGEGHAYPFVGRRPRSGNAQRKEAQLDACASRTSA